MRRGHQGRTDANHEAIVAAFRQMGATVRSTAMVGDGFPDLVVGVGYTRTLLVEVKQPKGKLTRAQLLFRTSWRGSPVLFVRTVDDVIALMQAQR